MFVMRAVSFQRSKPLTMTAATREIVARPGCVAPSATAARKSISLPFAKVETRSLQEWPGLFNSKKVERSRSDLVLTWSLPPCLLTQGHSEQLRGDVA